MLAVSRIACKAESKTNTALSPLIDKAARAAGREACVKLYSHVLGVGAGLADL